MAKKWYGGRADLIELRQRMFEYGARGCTLTEAANMEGVRKVQLIEVCREFTSVYRWFRKGKASIAGRTRSKIADMALESDDLMRDSDRLTALKMLSGMLRLDEPDTDLDAEEGTEDITSWAGLADKANKIEDELTDGTRRIDPVTQDAPRRRKTRRPDTVIED